MITEELAKEIGYEGCQNCEHQIEPLRMCEWAERGGDDIVHIICPMWEKRNEINEKSLLTPNQKLRLKEKIDTIELETGRMYTALTYQDGTTYLSFIDSMGYYKADIFTDFLPFIGSVFKPGKLYLLSDLLGETE
jgi:hypothetical protein